MHTLKVKKLHPEAKIPQRAHETDAGNDIYSIEYVSIPPNETKCIKTGISIELPQNTVGMICDRSSMGKKGLKVMGGIIDEGYRGEVIVCLANINKEAHININHGEKIAQLLILPIVYNKIEEIKELSETERGSNGFGSTGK